MIQSDMHVQINTNMRRELQAQEPNTTNKKTQAVGSTVLPSLPDPYDKKTRIENFCWCRNYHSALYIALELAEDNTLSVEYLLQIIDAFVKQAKTSKFFQYEDLIKIFQNSIGFPIEKDPAYKQFKRSDFSRDFNPQAMMCNRLHTPELEARVLQIIQLIEPQRLDLKDFVHASLAKWFMNNKLFQKAREYCDKIIDYEQKQSLGNVIEREENLYNRLPVSQKAFWEELRNKPLPKTIAKEPERTVKEEIISQDIQQQIQRLIQDTKWEQALALAKQQSCTNNRDELFLTILLPWFLDNVNPRYRALEGMEDLFKNKTIFHNFILGEIQKWTGTAPNFQRSTAQINAIVESLAKLVHTDEIPVHIINWSFARRLFAKAERYIATISDPTLKAELTQKRASLMPS